MWETYLFSHFIIMNKLLSLHNLNFLPFFQCLGNEPLVNAKVNKLTSIYWVLTGYKALHYV